MAISTLTEDVIIEFQDEESIRAHSLVLSLLSPVFCSMFAGKMKESRTKSVTVKDFKRADFEMFYRFINPVTAVLAESLTYDSAMRVLPIADYYQVDALKTRCVLQLENSPATVELLVLAETFSLEAVFNNCALQLETSAATVKLLVLAKKFDLDAIYQNCIAQYASEKFYTDANERWNADMAELEEMSEVKIISDILKRRCKVAAAQKQKMMIEFDELAEKIYGAVPTASAAMKAKNAVLSHKKDIFQF